MAVLYFADMRFPIPKVELFLCCKSPNYRIFNLTYFSKVVVAKLVGWHTKCQLLNSSLFALSQGKNVEMGVEQQRFVFPIKCKTYKGKIIAILFCKVFCGTPQILAEILFFGFVKWSSVFLNILI